MDNLYVSGRLTIPATELDVSFARSGGPGGQNVNKVNSKVTLHWQVRDNPRLPDPWRERVIARYGNRINSDGQLVLQSDRYRHQHRNVEDCLQKLREMLLECQRAPAKRVATKPTRASQRRRLDAKNRQSEKKRLRGRPRLE